MLDKLWHGSLTEAEALNLQLKGVEEVKRRLVVAPPDFIIKVSRGALPKQSANANRIYAICICAKL